MTGGMGPGGTDLKTLKDLIWDSNDELFSNRLKQEAIKWMKELKEHNARMVADNFIKYFFNLTEEGLK